MPKGNIQLRIKLLRLLTGYFKIIVILLVVIILAVGYFGFIKNKYEEIKKVGTLAYGQKLTEKESRINYLEGLKKMKENYEKISLEEVRKLNRVLPPLEEMPNLFGQLESMMKEAGLEMISLDITQGLTLAEEIAGLQSVAAEQNKKSTQANLNTNSSQNLTITTVKSQEQIQALLKKVQIVNIALNIEGLKSYGQLKDFLDYLENNMHLVEIESLSFAPDADQYALNLKTYYLIP